MSRWETWVAFTCLFCREKKGIIMYLHKYDVEFSLPNDSSSCRTLPWGEASEQSYSYRPPYSAWSKLPDICSFVFMCVAFIRDALKDCERRFWPGLVSSGFSLSCACGTVPGDMERTSETMTKEETKNATKTARAGRHPAFLLFIFAFGVCDVLLLVLEVFLKSFP